MNLSDKKALLVHNVSSAIKSLCGAGSTDSPQWTIAMEKEFATMSNKSLDQINFLMEMLNYHKKLGKLPQ